MASWMERAQAVIQRVQASPRLRGDQRIAQSIQKLNEVIAGRPRTVPMPDGEAPSLTSAVSPQLEAKLALLWKMSGSQPSAFLQYLMSVPDPEIQALVSNPTVLRAAVDKIIRGEGISRPTTPGDGFPAPELQSSNVAGFLYDPQKSRMFVKFKSGSIYGYDAVPPWVNDVVQKGGASAKTNDRTGRMRWWIGKNPSLGAAVHQFLKRMAFPYARIR